MGLLSRLRSLLSRFRRRREPEGELTEALARAVAPALAARAVLTAAVQLQQQLYSEAVRVEPSRPAASAAFFAPSPRMTRRERRKLEIMASRKDLGPITRPIKAARRPALLWKPMVFPRYTHKARFPLQR